MKTSSFEKRVSDIILPVLEDMGFDLVRVHLTGESSNHTLQIMAEPLDETKTINVDDCAKISRELSDVLDVDDPIEGRYVLEVSSPGLDRPLTRPKDFVRFTGLEAKVEIYPPFEGQKRFKGRIVSASEEEGFTLEMENGEQIDINFAAVVRAKLILNDELLQMA